MRRLERTVFLTLFIGCLAGVGQAQAVTQNPQAPVLSDDFRRTVEQYLKVQKDPAAPSPLFVTRQNRTFGAGAWWTNTALVERLGLTDDQKLKIERAFENHRLKIVSTTELLEKEEAQLARLLAADPLDRNAVLGQIDRVISARGEMERENAAMTLEMREVLTRAQWAQLPPAGNIRVFELPAGVRGGGRGQRGGAPTQQTPGGPGGRRGPAQQQ